MPDDSDSARLTTLLMQAADSPLAAAAELLPLVYSQLRAAAQLRMASERAGHTLQPTALVHEAFLKLVGKRELPWQNRRHFYVAAAEAMRQILLDHAKARGRVKRGGDRSRVPLSAVDVAESWNLTETMSLDDAIRRLGERDEATAEVVRLRFYAGLTVQQAADVLGVSSKTVVRRWEFGRTWLFRELKRSEGHEDSESTSSDV